MRMESNFEINLNLTHQWWYMPKGWPTAVPRISNIQLLKWKWDKYHSCKCAPSPCFKFIFRSECILLQLVLSCYFWFVQQQPNQFNQCPCLIMSMIAKSCLTVCIKKSNSNIFKKDVWFYWNVPKYFYSL